MPFKVPKEVNEQTTSWISGQATGNGGVVIPNGSIATATLTLTRTGTSTVINGRVSVDIKNSFNAQGEFEFELTAADNSIIADSDVPSEWHSITIRILTTGGVSITEEIQYEVRNLKMIS